MEKLNISELRRIYTRDGLLEEGLPGDPLILLRNWIAQAVETAVPDPSAMSLATVTEEMAPNVRIVLLKGIEEDAISFYTNYRSDKAADLQRHPFAACCFWWPELERQVRLRGPVEKVSREESAGYFAGRPRDSQIGAWASSQSSEVKSREELERSFEEFRRKFDGRPVPLPDHWGGYRIRLSAIEFWQGRPGRLHDRIRYLKAPGGWSRQRLAP